jgi:Tfp pilus assembly protein PilV
MMKDSKKRNQAGISLIEVTAAMVVLAIGILGLAPMMTVTMDANSFSRELSQADNLAQDRLEALRLQGAFSPLPFTTVENDLQGRFTRATRIDAFESDATVPPRVYRVRVTLTWPDHNGIPRSATYMTYFSKS